MLYSHLWLYYKYIFHQLRFLFLEMYYAAREQWVGSFDSNQHWVDSISSAVFSCNSTVLAVYKPDTVSKLFPFIHLSWTDSFAKNSLDFSESTAIKIYSLSTYFFFILARENFLRHSASCNEHKTISAKQYNRQSSIPNQPPVTHLVPYTAPSTLYTLCSALTKGAKRYSGRDHSWGDNKLYQQANS